MCGGGGDKEGGFGGGMGTGMNKAGGDASSDMGGNRTGRSSSAGKGGSEGGNESGSTPRGLRSIDVAHAGLGLAGPQLSRAKDNRTMTGLSYGIQALGMMGLPFAGALAMGVRAVRDYGRSYADRSAAEIASLGAPREKADGSPAPVSGGLTGVSKPVAQVSAQAGASDNVGSGSAGSTVIMGADKTRTGAGAGSRAKSGSAVRGFGSGGLKL